MTGVLNACIAMGAANVAVTVGSDLGNHGYSTQAGLGAASPTSVFGIVITMLASVDSSADFRFRLSGETHSQSIFRHLLVRDGAGSFRKYNSADASFATGAGVSSWTWGDGSNRVWTSPDASEVHVVQFFR